MDSKELLTKAKQAYRVRDYESAESILRRYLENSSDDSDAQILLGSVLAGDKRLEEAAATFRKAISLDEANVEAFNNLGVVLRQSGQNDAAIRAFNQALSLDGDRADIHYNLGNLYKVIGDQSNATKHYQAAIESDSGVTMAYNNLGNLLMGQGDIAGAIEVFRDGIQVDPNHPSLHYNLGVAYQFQDMTGEAITAYEQALKSRPGWPAALTNLGVLYQKSGRLQDAMRSFSEAVKAQPDDATALNNLGTVKALLGDVDGAVEDFQRSLRVTPEYERPAENLAQLLQAHQEIEEAPRILGSLALRYPRNQIVQRALAENALARGEYETAEKALGVLADRDQKDRYALRMLGVLAFRRRDRARAETFFKRLESLHPPDRSYQKDIARLYVEDGKTEDALKTIDTFLSGEPEDLDGLVCRADILMEQERYDEALAFLGELSERFPQSARVLSRMARVHRRMGDRQEAINAADRLISLQGHRGNAEDLTSLNESLQMYEEAVEAFEDDHSDLWRRNLERLSELVRDAGEAPAEEAAEALTPDESPEIDEDSIPILDLAPMEFEIDDELEIESEDLEDDVMWEGEEPDSLLRQAEALGGGYGATPPPEAPAPSAPPSNPTVPPPPTAPAPDLTAPAAMEPPAPAAATPEGGDSTGAGGGSGDDSAGAGTPPWETPPEEPAPQGRSSEPPPYPAQPYPQPAAPQPATPQPAFTGSISVTSVPPWPTPQPSGPPGGQVSQGTPAPPATQVPPGAVSGVFSQPPPVEVSDEEAGAGEIAAGEMSPDGEEAFPEELRLDDLLEGESTSEDYDIHATESEEPELSLDEDFEVADDFGSGAGDMGPDGEEADHAEIGAPEADMNAPGADGSALGGGDAALSGEVADAAEIPPAQSPEDAPGSGAGSDAESDAESENISKAALFDYLLNLSEALPGDQRKAFAESDLPLKIASIRTRLLGSSGLRGQIERAGIAPARRTDVAVTPTRIADTFSYLSQISGFLPKSAIGSALQDRLRRISDKLSGARERE